ncbi:unnamed protein product, partial [Hapterophycus canaliculatus]
DLRYPAEAQHRGRPRSGGVVVHVPRRRASRARAGSSQAGRRGRCAVPQETPAPDSSSDNPAGRCVHLLLRRRKRRNLLLFGLLFPFLVQAPAAA